LLTVLSPFQIIDYPDGDISDNRTTGPLHRSFLPGINTHADPEFMPPRHLVAVHFKLPTKTKADRDATEVPTTKGKKPRASQRNRFIPPKLNKTLFKVQSTRWRREEKKHFVTYVELVPGKHSLVSFAQPQEQIEAWIACSFLDPEVTRFNDHQGKTHKVIEDLVLC